MKCRHLQAPQPHRSSSSLACHWRSVNAPLVVVLLLCCQSDDGCVFFSRTLLQSCWKNKHLLPPPRSSARTEQEEMRSGTGLLHFGLGNTTNMQPARTSMMRTTLYTSTHSKVIKHNQSRNTLRRNRRREKVQKSQYLNDQVTVKCLSTVLDCEKTNTVGTNDSALSSNAEKLYI